MQEFSKNISRVVVSFFFFRCPRIELKFFSNFTSLFLFSRILSFLFSFTKICLIKFVFNALYNLIGYFFFFLFSTGIFLQLIIFPLSSFFFRFFPILFYYFTTYVFFFFCFIFVYFCLFSHSVGDFALKKKKQRSVSTFRYFVAN